MSRFLDRLEDWLFMLGLLAMGVAILELLPRIVRFIGVAIIIPTVFVCWGVASLRQRRLRREIRNLLKEAQTARENGQTEEAVFLLLQAGTKWEMGDEITRSSMQKPLRDLHEIVAALQAIRTPAGDETALDAIHQIASGLQKLIDQPANFSWMGGEIKRGAAAEWDALVERLPELQAKLGPEYGHPQLASDAPPYEQAEPIENSNKRPDRLKTLARACIPLIIGAILWAIAIVRG